MLWDGQLWQLTTLEAWKMWIETVIYWAGWINSPAWQVAKILDSDWYTHNSPQINQLISLKPEVISIEWENIPIELLRELESKWMNIKPNIEMIETISEKRTEKELLVNIWQNTTQFVFINSIDDLIKVFNDLWKWIIKTPNWYDWKWQIFINSIDDIKKLKDSDIWENFIYEKLVDFKTEISVIVWRRKNWEIVVFEPIENKHEKWILINSISLANIDEEIKEKAKKIAIQITEILAIEWILAVEMFVLNDWTILINELAPRPHNSWHLTIEWYNQSQYAIFIKAILDLPFWELRLINKTRMMNLLWNCNNKIPTNSHKIIQKWNFTLYNYWKKEIKPWRKMWHITKVY